MRHWAALLASLLFAGALHANTPTLIQHVTGPNTLGNVAQNGTVSAGGSVNLPLKNKSLVGDVALVAFTCDNTNTPTMTVTDDGGNTYTQVATVTQATDGDILKLFSTTIATGATVIHGTVSTASDFCQLSYDERNNLTATTDGSSTTQANAATTSCTGSFTTTTAGDFIYQVYIRTNSTNTTYTSAGGIFSFGGIEEGFADQGGVQVSAGAINPCITSGSARNFATIGVALKQSAGAAGGTIPTNQIWWLRFQHNNTQDETSATVTLQQPTSASNGVVIVGQSAGGTYALSSTTAITDTAASTYTFLGCKTVTPDSACLEYAKGTSASDGRTLTITMSGTDVGGHGATFFTGEVLNVNQTTPVDTAFGTGATCASCTSTTCTTGGNIVCVSGTQNTGTGSPAMPNFTATPSNQNEMIFVLGSMAADTATGWSSPASGITQVPQTFTGQGNPANSDENNPAGIDFNGASTAARTYVATHDTINSTGVGTFSVVGAAFILATAATNFPQVFVIRP